MKAGIRSYSQSAMMNALKFAEINTEDIRSKATSHSFVSFFFHEEHFKKTIFIIPAWGKCAESLSGLITRLET